MHTPDTTQQILANQNLKKSPFLVCGQGVAAPYNLH